MERKILLCYVLKKLEKVYLVDISEFFEDWLFYYTLSVMIKTKFYKSIDKGYFFLSHKRTDGVVAQLEEHHNGIVGVVGSNPINSTIGFRT